MNRLLNMRYADRIEIDSARIGRKDLSQFYDLFFGLHIGIGITVEMETVHLHAALCHHMPRYGTVYSARNQKQTFSRSTDGHTVGSVEKRTEYERRTVFADIDIYVKGRIMHVDRQGFEIRKKPAADFPTDFYGGQREFFIRTVRFHFETSRRTGNEFCRFKNIVHIRRGFECDAHGVNSEYLFETGNDEIRCFLLKAFYEIASAVTVQFVTDSL